MPVVHTIDSIKIFIYFFDHAPPHFHAEYNEYEELFEIKTLETLIGSLPNKQRKKVLAWAKDNQDKLMAAWNENNPTT